MPGMFAAREWRGNRGGTRAATGSDGCLGGLHGSDPLLHLTRGVRHDSDHALNQHQLTAVVHFVLFDAQQHLETRFARRRHSRRQLDTLRQCFLGKVFEPPGDMLALGSKQVDDFRFLARRLLGGDHLRQKGREIKSF